MSNYELMVEDSFSAAHQLRGYQGKCENLHGHTFRVQVYLKGKKLDDSGMLFDFKIMKKALSVVLEEFDHKNLNELGMFKEKNPTAENLAAEIYKKLKKVKPAKVTVFESDRASASYYG